MPAAKRPENAVASTRPEYRIAVRRASSFLVYLDLVSFHCSLKIGLLVMSAPTREQIECSREERSFSDTQKEAHGNKTGKIVCACCRRRYAGPYAYPERQIQ
jgi:hypothetical protein